ncbi:hypothetical protein QJ857_gp0779 [Tupanvirus soda lake]|uniref:Minor capsid protein P8 central region domain-containing protein n=2 Tax=Tupanvirus TaxID=2094720 RepID=A0A6N1NKX2_9VIRU|nr:hypothetical protein QJ857_gp0779 [Tupanvirus soda lake]QKU35269.1 hypothetical protein [Tupanvirus soda lake]
MSLPKGAVKKSMNNHEIMKTPFIMFQAHKDDYYNMSQDSLRGVQEDTILSKVFFHPKNVDLIQKQIIIDVFRKTNGEYLIEKQNEADLQIVMRSIFIQHARHLPDNIKGQIRELNNLVVDEVVPGIVSEIMAHFGYIARAFGPMQIMDRPENVSNAGLKTLPSVTRSFDPDRK